MIHIVIGAMVQPVATHGGMGRIQRTILVPKSLLFLIFFIVTFKNFFIGLNPISNQNQNFFIGFLGHIFSFIIFYNEDFFFSKSVV